MWLDLSVGKSPTEQEVDDVPTKPARPAAPGGAVHVAPQVRQADLPLHHGRPARDPRPRLPSGGPDQDDHAGACRPRAGPGGTGPLRGSPGQARHGGRRGDCRAPGTHGCRPRQTRALRPSGSAWKSVLAATATAFTSPSHALFIDLACARSAAWSQSWIPPAGARMMPTIAWYGPVPGAWTPCGGSSSPSPWRMWDRGRSWWSWTTRCCTVPAARSTGRDRGETPCAPPPTVWSMPGD